MLSPFRLESVDILNISADFVSPLSSVPLSQKSDSSTEPETQVIEDSLKLLPIAPLSLTMSTIKKSRAFDEMYDISSSPENVQPAKRRAVDHDPIPSSLPRHKARASANSIKSRKSGKSKPSLEPVAAETDEDCESFEEQEDSDEYRPTQTKKAATLGSKIAKPATGGTLKSRANTAAGRKAGTISKATKKDAAEKAVATTARKPNHGVKDKMLSGHTAKEGHSIMTLTKMRGRKRAIDYLDENVDQSADHEGASRKDRVQTFPITHDDKRKIAKLPITKDSRKLMKTTKTIINHPITGPSPDGPTIDMDESAMPRISQEAIEIRSSPPVQTVKASSRKSNVPLAKDQQTNKDVIVKFGKEGPRNQDQMPSKRKDMRNAKPLSKADRLDDTTSFMTATHSSACQEKTTQPKNIVDHTVYSPRTAKDSNIARDDEDALAGFNIELNNRPNNVSHQSKPCAEVDVASSKGDYAATIARSGQRARLEVAVTDAMLSKLTTSQIAMPPPKPAAEAMGAPPVEATRRGSDSSGSRHRQERHKRTSTKDNKLMTSIVDAVNNRRSKSQQLGPTLAGGIRKASPSQCRDADDSGYQSTIRSHSKMLKDVTQVAEMRRDGTKLIPTTIISSNGSPMLTVANHVTRGLCGMAAMVDHQIAGPKHLRRSMSIDVNYADHEPAMSVLGAKGNISLTGEIEHVSDRPEDASCLREQLALERSSSDKLDNVAFQTGQGDASIGSTDALTQRVVVTARRSMEDLLEWRSTLQVHQRRLFDQLVDNAETLVSYLVQREEVIQDLVDDYRSRGQDLIKQMEISHAKEYQKYCTKRDAQIGRALV